MDSAKILNKLKAMQIKGLTAAAYVLLAHILPFVPIDKGVGEDSLRGSAKIKPGQSGGVDISFGGSGASSKYAAYQYFEAKQHNFKGGAMARMLELLHGDDKNDVKGDINKDRYAAAYRQAVDEGTLTKFPNGARWFDIVLKDEEVQRRAWMVYAQTMRGNREAAAG